MYDVILVGIDGSDPAHRAQTHALELAEKCDAELHAIGVVNTNRYGEPALSSTELVVNEVEDRLQGELSEFAERADNYGVDTYTRCCHGAPHEEILAYAEEVDADVMILGYQGHSHSEDHVGSITNRVVRQTERPLLLA